MGTVGRNAQRRALELSRCRMERLTSGCRRGMWWRRRAGHCVVVTAEATNLRQVRIPRHDHFAGLLGPDDPAGMNTVQIQATGAFRVADGLPEYEPAWTREQPARATSRAVGPQSTCA